MTVPPMLMTQAHELLYPQRPELERVCNIVRPCTDCLRLSTSPSGRITCDRHVDTSEQRAELWESLVTHQVIPLDWIESSKRFFVCHPCDGKRDWGCESCDEQPVCKMPRSVHDLLAITSDPKGIMAAEALALELVARMLPWKKRWIRRRKGPTSFGWRVVPRAVYNEDPVMQGWSLQHQGLWPRAFDDAWRERQGIRLKVGKTKETFPTCMGLLNLHHTYLDHEWLARSWLTVIEDGPNPFEPLLAIWKLGYALHHVSDSRIDLVCPALSRVILFGNADTHCSTTPCMGVMSHS